MGGGNTKQKRLTQYELTEFTNQTNLSYSQVENLHKFYKQISSSLKDDGVIDPQEFSSTLSLSNQELILSVFNVFDLNNDKVINFREFLLGIANLLNEKLDYKIRFSFNMIDQGRKKMIKISQIIDFFQQLLQQFPGMKIDENGLKSMITEQITQVIESTKTELSKMEERQIIKTEQDDPPQFENDESKDVDTKQKIETNQELSMTYTQYKQFVLKNPVILKWLSVDSKNMINNANKLNFKP